MLCQNCGTEIADKAIVCYRCGHGPVAHLRKPAPASSPWRSVATVVALVLLALGALFLGQAGTIDVPPAIRYAVMAVALLLLGWRFLARRRR